MITPRKSGRLRKARTSWGKKGAPSAAKDPKIPKKAAYTVKKTALKPVATGPLTESTGLNKDRLPELPDYEPPFNSRPQASESLGIGISELEKFQKLLTPAIVDHIMPATNSYAKRVRKKAAESPEQIRRLRPWKPVNSTDIWRYIGCLLYMGNLQKKETRSIGLDQDI
jgi:Transposase IS4